MLRVLIVEPDESIRYTLGRRLSEDGYKVDLAADAAQERHRIGRANLIVADAPSIDGCLADADAPLLALTRDEPWRLRAVDAANRADAVLQRPCTYAEVRDALAGLVEEADL